MTITRKVVTKPAEATPAGTDTGPKLEHFAAWLQRAAAAHRLNGVIATILGAFALGLNLHMSGSINFWFDEAFSFRLIDQHFGSLWRIIWSTEPNMELYYIVLYVWHKASSLVGLAPTEFVLRFPSAVFAALSTVVVYFLGHRYWGRPAALLGALLLALNPLQLFYAQQARAYSLQMLLICCSWYALLAALTARGRQVRWSAAYVIATTLAIYAHVFTGLIVIAQVAAYGGLVFLPGPWRALSRRALPRFAVSLGIAGVAIIPMVVVSRNGGHNYWIQPTTTARLTDFFVNALSGGNLVYLAALVLSGTGAVLLAVNAHLPCKASLLRRGRLMRHLGDAGGFRDGPPAPGTFVLVCWFVAPMAMSYALTQEWLNLHLFLARYLVVVTPAICLLAGAGAAMVGQTHLRTALMLLLLGAALPQVPAYYAHADTQSFRSATQWLKHRYQPGDGIACYPAAWCKLPTGYYFEAYTGQAHLDAESPGDTTDLPTLATYCAHHARLFFIVATFNTSPATLEQIAQLRHWLDLHDHLIGQTSSTYTSNQFIDRPLTTSVTVRLYAPADSITALSRFQAT